MNLMGPRYFPKSQTELLLSFLLNFHYMDESEIPEIDQSGNLIQLEIEILFCFFTEIV